MLSESEFIALLSLIGTLAALLVNAFVFVRTGKVIDTTTATLETTNATHELVNGQSTALIAATGTVQRAAGYAAGQVAPTGVPDVTLPVTPPAP